MMWYIIHGHTPIFIFDNAHVSIKISGLVKNFTRSHFAKNIYHCHRCYRHPPPPLHHHPPVILYFRSLSNAHISLHHCMDNRFLISTGKLKDKCFNRICFKSQLTSSMLGNTDNELFTMVNCSLRSGWRRKNEGNFVDE